MRPSSTGWPWSSDGEWNGVPMTEPRGTPLPIVWARVDGTPASSGIHPTLGTSTQAPSCFELATAASTKAMPATPSTMPGCSNGVGTCLAAAAADRPFERPVQVAERLVEAFGVARGEPQVGLDRAGEVAVLGPLAVELERLAAGVVLQDGVVGDRPFEGAGRAADAEAVVVLGADGDLRGGDGGDPAVVELGQDGEVVVEGAAGDERLEPAADPRGVAAGDEPDELVGVRADVAAAARGRPPWPGRPARTPASAPRPRAWWPASPAGYHASTLRTSPIVAVADQLAGEHDHREAGVGVGDDERRVLARRRSRAAGGPRRAWSSAASRRARRCRRPPPRRPGRSGRRWA